MRWDAAAGQGHIYYASTSRRLIDDVAQLLLRVGVFAHIKLVKKPGYRDSWRIHIYGAENQARFLRHVGVDDAKAAAAQEVLDRLEGAVRNTNLDTSPREVFWDPIVEITGLGDQYVYDGTVAGTHNFVANGISVHNSLEQDADMVILLNRPDAFDRDDPRGGEADFILAKHRNGPTKTVTVAHQLHLSRFANMAR